MNRWYGVLALCAVVAVVWSSVRMSPGMGYVHGLGDDASAVTYGDGDATAWTPTRDEGRIAAVRPGMHEREVVARLGPPLRESCLERGHGRTLVYSSAAVRGGTGWWAHTVHVGAGGHVTRVESHYQVD